MSAPRMPFLAANWKMHHGPKAAAEYIAKFVGLVPAGVERTVAFFPPAVSVQAVANALAGRPDLKLGVQNIHWEDKGAFTGELSAPMAREAGAGMALVGHSERRHVFGETEAECAKKVAAALRNGMQPMLCVGEKLEEREAGTTNDVILRQLRAGLAEVKPDQFGTLLVAYEPVWAIGTGRTATPADAASAHTALRAALRALGGSAGEGIPILYGGSVSPANARALLDTEGVDGLLVGGASLDPENWAKVVGA
jgi:triosephosphate isomerase (TIM)